MNVLIVDDNPAMRGLIKGFIREFAQEIFECADGCEVLDAYRAHLPDWVLMDVEMPKVDGFTATRNLIRKIPAARVVIVTRYDDDELRKEASLAGACGYVLKEDLTALQSVFLAAS
jgi:DNA-binding NarL/FixJ family response regulator